MVEKDIVSILRQHGVHPSAQRVAVAQYVLSTHQHFSADAIWKGVLKKFPVISLATVYNTLHLFVEKGLLQEVHLAEGSVVYDPNPDKHHHFIDDQTGAIYDIPWEQVRVRSMKKLRGFDIHDYQVVMRGRKR